MNQRTVPCGVPQGSTLLYVNSIRYLIITGRTYLFADDTTLIYSGNNVEKIKKNMANDNFIIMAASLKLTLK